MAGIRSAAELVESAADAEGSLGIWFVRDVTRQDEERVSFAEIAVQAARLGGALRGLGLRRGDRLAFIVPAAELSVPLFFGAMRAGAVLVPIAPPTTAGQLQGYAARVGQAVRETGATFLVVTRKVHRLLRDAAHGARLVTMEELASSTEPAPQERLAGDDAALLQLSDRGGPVTALTHADLLRAVDAAERALAVDRDDRFVSWLPLFQDAGLTALLLPFRCRLPTAFVPSVQFLKDPRSWLQVITRTRGSMSFAPAHGYDFCARRVAPAELTGIDLSSWRIAGAISGEIPREIADTFADGFSRVGFRASAFTAARAPLPAPTQATAPCEAPLSRGQKALWFLAELSPDSLAYNVPFCFRLAAPFDGRALRAAFQAIVDRHAALRTVFRSRGGEPYREVRARCEVSFDEIEASSWTDAELIRRVEEDAAGPLDLAAGPLFRVRLFRRGPAQAVLLLVAHHINADVHSLGIIASDLASLYEQAASGRGRPVLPATAHSYDDFVDWQRELLAGPQGARLRDYWAVQLRGAPAALQLPTDRPRPPFQTHRGAALAVRLDGELAAELRELARRRETTLYTVLLAIYQSLLHLYTGQRDLLVASPASGRSGAAFDDVVGYFVNTIPLRGRIERTTTFESLLDELRVTVLEALDHQDLPFPSIVEAAGAPRDPSRSPLCQVMFALQNPRLPGNARDLMKAVFGGRADLGGLVMETFELDRRYAQFDMTLMLVELDEQLGGFYEYNTDLFDHATAERFVADFARLARAVTADPAARIASHDRAVCGARARNATAIAYPDGRVHRAIEREATRRPDAIAVDFGGATLTYGELNRRANRLARHLRAAGVGRDALVGVTMDRSAELVTALLAIIKAGAAYVPLDPTYPADRLRFLVHDAAPALIIADPAHRQAASQGGAPMLTTDELVAIAGEPSAPGGDLDVDVAPGDLVYVIYTSGSTGLPKGAGNTHAGLWNRLSWMQARYRLGEEDCVLQKTPYSFDVSVWEFFWPLMTGARLAVARPEGHRDSAYLLEEIERRGVTTIHFVPSMLEAFLHEPDVHRARRLARVIASGEALSHALVTRFFDRLPGVQLENLYGPTEASIDVTAWTCEPSRATVPIGRPIANTQIHILDDRLEPAPIGGAGELYIGGVGLARGYHRRPELTAARFVPDPFSAEPGGRLYRSGDLALVAEDGAIEYQGRNDDQIKIRGFRIELGEIEAAACAHPAVAECVAVARHMPAGSARLEAFLVASSGAAIDTGAVDAVLRARLPDYMVPSRLVVVDAIPLTHSGKTDRRALLERSAPVGGRGGEPSTPEETALVEIWRQVLGTRSIGVLDNYFALGGDSIRSLQMRALARARGLDFDVQALFARQTIAELAQVVRPAVGGDASTEPFALVPPAERGRLAWCEDAFPATQLQLGMLYHSELTEDSWTYHDVLGFDLEMEWREAPMREALARVMGRHPVLRSSFDLAGFSRPLQIVHREVAPPLAVEDLRSLGAEPARAAIREHVARDKQAGYRLSAAPLFRIAVHLLEARCVRLTLSFHHAILDGWSTATFLRELLVEYLDLIGATGLAPLGRPAHSFSDFAALEAEAVASDASRAHWRAVVGDSELAALPAWPERYRRRESDARVVLPIDAALHGSLVAAAARLNAPLKSVLLAGHARAIAAFTGTDDLVTGMVVHGRPEVADAERILGLFLNTVPVRARLTGATWASLVGQLTAAEAEAFPHRRFPLREIQREVGRKTLFEAAFNFVRFHIYDELLASGALRLLGYEVHENTNFAVMANFVASPIDGGLSLHVEYDDRRVAGEQARQIAEAHLLALAALAADTGAPVAAAAVLGDDQRALLDDWNRTGDAAEPVPVHQLFERQADRTPAALAIVSSGIALTYAELDEQANGVAYALRAAGARPRDVIAVCAEPSLERAAAVLGALKAGCAYLPLDPSFPAERLAAMLDRAGTTLALVTGRHAGAPFLADRMVVPLGALRARRDRPGISSAPLDPAYVIFTSGSTGRPKGIEMPHAALANLVAWQVGESAAGAITAQFSSFSFDVSFQEMFSTWASGGCLVMVPDEARADTRELARLLAARRVARLFAPVVILQQLAEVAEELGLDLPDLREVNTAGEQLEITGAVRAFFRRHPECRLANHYGPSETHVATFHRLDAHPDGWPFAPPIGWPLPGVRAYIVDGAGQPAPIGVPGELFLAGACVATGYVGEPLLTDERFAPDPHRPGDRMYRTGDMARRLPDGTIEFLGRRDGQLKIRGYRVELGEVEAAIAAAGGDQIRRATVVAVPSRSRSTRHELAAYIVGAADRPVDLARVRDRLARTLPAHMIPSSFTLLDSIPVGPTGKLDRRALPAPGAAAPTQRPHAAPEGEVEVELERLWREVLVAERVGATDDFFESGGDSLSAVRLMAGLERRFGLSLPISALLAAPTIRELGRVVQSSAPRAPAGAIVAVQPAGARPPLFLVHPIGGTILCYVPLSRRLGDDQPLHGLEARGLDGRAPPRASIAQMADAYAAEIAAAQPEGVVHIGGWSFGGVVAVEIARRLTDAGRRVAPVVLLDSVAGMKWKVELTREHVLEWLALERDLDAEADRSAPMEHAAAVMSAHLRAILDHEQRPYAGPVVLLRSIDPMPARLRRMHDLFGSTRDDRTNGWSAICPRLTVIPVRGDHLTLVREPHVARVAEIVRAVVDGADGRVKGESELHGVA